MGDDAGVVYLGMRSLFEDEAGETIEMAAGFRGKVKSGLSTIFLMLAFLCFWAY